MKKDTKSKGKHLLQIEDLRMRLEEAEGTLRAIREGEVDALVASGPQGAAIYTLKGAEQPYRVFVEAMYEGAATLDSEGTILYCNPYFAEMVKASPDQIIGSSIYDFIAPADASGFESALRAGKSEKTKVDICLKREDRELLPAQVSVNALLGTEVPLVCIVATDLTERKRYEEEILKAHAELERRIQERTAELLTVNETLRSEIAEHKRTEEALNEARVNAINEKNRLEAVMEALPVGVALLDANGGQVVANTMFGTIWSGPRPAAKTVADYEKYRAWWTDTGQAVQPQEWASARAVLKGETVVGQTMEIERFDGSRAFVLNSAAPIFDAAGKIAGSSVAILDITQLKELETSLRKANERLDLLSETASRLLATERPQEIVNELCERVMTFLDCHAFFNFLMDKEKGRLRLSAYAGIPEETAKGMEWLDLGVAVCGCAARDGCRIVAEDIPNTPDPRTELVKSFGIKAYVCHPLLSAGRVIGTLSFGTRTRTTFTEDELTIMKTVADQVAIAMERVRSRDELEIRVRERTEELAKANKELKAEMVVRQRTEQALRKLTDNLNERIKEANCRYSVSYHVGRQHLSLEERLREIVNCIPSGWQYPEITCARVVLQEREYKTDNFKETAWRQASEIVLDGVRIGVVEVFFLEERPVTVEGPFLREERNLINSIAIELGEMIAHLRADTAVKAASLYTRSLIEASLDPLITISADGKVTDVNRATELVTGVPRSQLVGSDFSAYFTEPEKAREGYQRVFQEGFVRDYPLAIRHTSGRVIEVLYSATLYKNEAGEVQGVFAAARDITERKRGEDALKESEHRLRLLSSQLLVAQEKERRRVAQEIHDSLGASLAATKYRIESTLSQLGDTDPQTKEALKSIIPIIQGTIDEARRIQMALRPSILDDLGLLATIGWFCRQYESTYSAIRVKPEINIEEHEVPDSLKTVIFRVLQEAMNNIAKHSKATRVLLALRKTDQAIQLVVQDNGHGFMMEDILSSERTSRGLGLDSMRERTELAGGSFAIESTASGTVIQASWPL